MAFYENKRLNLINYILYKIGFETVYYFLGNYRRFIRKFL